MFTTTILIAGGLVVAGTRILLKRKHARTPVWLVQHDGTRVKSYAMVVDAEESSEIVMKRKVDTSYSLATISLGLSVVSEFIFDPIKWLGLPFDISTFSLLIEQVYDDRHQSRYGAQIATIGVFVVVFTVSDQIFLISIIQWCYFFYRKASFEVYRQLAYFAARPDPVTV